MKNIYQEIFEYMNKGLAVFKVFNDGENFEFIEYNRAAEAIDGKTREEVLGRELTEVFPVARELGFVELLHEVYKTGKRIHKPLSFYSHGNNSFWREIELSKLPDGNILYIYSDLQNQVKTVKNTEMNLFTSEEIIEKSPFPKEIINIDGRIIYVNPAFEKITGYSKEECKGMRAPFPWWPEDKKEDMVQSYMRALAEDDVENEMKLINKAGEEFWAQIKNTRVTYNGEIKYYLSYWYDITDRKKAEENLFKNEMEKRLILDSIVSALNIYDLKEERNIYVNKPYTDITGWTKEEINAMGQKYLDYFHPDDLPSLLKHIKEVGESKIDTVKSHEYRFKRKDGEWIWLLTHDKPFERDENGNVTKVIGSFIDVTERVKAVQALKFSEKREKEANKAKSEFLANMSHEIRTPLNGVLGFTDLLMTTQLDDNQRQYVKNIQNSSIVLMDLINDILDFSKIEAGKLELENERFDLKDLLEKTVDIVRLKTQNKGLVLKRNFSPDVPAEIHGDAVRLRQILLNFLSNAIKFTEKGHIELKVILLEKDPETRKAEILFSVRDTGIGIEKAKISSIVEEFSQEDSSTTRKFGGTGLGLAISKRLIEKMDSELIIDSVKGKGSEFAFKVSFNYSEQITDEIQEAKKSIETDKKTARTKSKISDRVITVLIAEDNKLNRELLIRYLSQSGSFKVYEAKTGREAVEIFARKKSCIDLIFMDIQMPEMDGYRASQEIRRIENEGKQVPIIALTAKAVKGEETNILNAGMTEYLTKPLRLADLSRTIKNYFQFAKSMENKAFSERNPKSSQKDDIIAFLRSMSLTDKEIRQILVEYEKNFAEQMPLLEEAVNNEEMGEIEWFSHALKGTSANIGNLKIAQVLTEINHAAKKGEKSKIKDLFEKMKTLYETLMEQI